LLFFNQVPIFFRLDRNYLQNTSNIECHFSFAGKTASQLADTMSQMNNVRSSAGAAQLALETQFRRATPILIAHLTRFRTAIFHAGNKINRSSRGSHRRVLTIHLR
jgi:hypothetical protein